ncbi:MAG: epoxide hydrolase [Actinomycetota bacterium]|jgi:microsomal epoxide hydrolase|nr:epoxide hydrolase [Actinomycetota bacterium]
MASDDIRPFRVEVPAEVLDDLRDRLARTRWPDQIPGSGWGYGTNLEYLQELCTYWRNDFDWRAQEERFNRWPHFLTEIDGQQIHFIHARSDKPNALPLIVTHGWPGSVAEFLDVIEPLREDFHVVVPSLPGYGWSGPTTEPGWDVQRVAQAWKTLMARLGYDRYGAQGGDWGAMISARLAAIDPEHMVGLHSNMLLAFPEDASGIELTESEIADLVGVGEFMKTGSAYQEIQGKNPQTLGYGLTDSPAGLAGWIVEKFLVWTDNEGSPEDAVTRDQLLTNVTVYWVTKTINSSIRLYCESQRTDRFGPTGEYITVPTAAAVFPKEMFRIPEAYAKSRFNLVRYNRFDRGGHFAALEEPDLLVQDVRQFFHDLASAPS